MMSKDKTVIHKVPVYSIEGLLGIKDKCSTARNKVSETVIQENDSETEEISATEASQGLESKLSGKNGKSVSL